MGKLHLLLKFPHSCLALKYRSENLFNLIPHSNLCVREIHLTQKAYAYSSARLGKDLAFLEALLNGVSPVSLDSFLATALQIHDNLTRMEGQDLTE